MQNISEIARKKARLNEPHIKPFESSKLALSNDLIFFMSLINPNIRRVIPAQIISVQKDSTNTRILKVENSHRINLNLRHFSSPKILYIKNVRIADFNDANVKFLDVLILESIDTIDLSIQMDVKAFKLVLRSLTIKYSDFCKLISIIDPQSLELYNVEFKNDNIDYINANFVQKMINLKLISLKLVETSIAFENFNFIVRKLELKEFTFKKDQNSFIYHSRGSSLSFLSLKWGYPLNWLEYIKEIDILSLSSDQKILNLPNSIYKSVKHLILTDFRIDQKFIKSFTGLSTIIINNSTFTGLSLYDFIKFNPNLRFFMVKNMELPLDCIRIMKTVFNDCHIKLNNGKIVLVNKGNPIISDIK